MKNSFVWVTILTLSACSTTPEVATPDPFTVIAREWQGAQIEDMIRQWGAPRELKQESETGGAGSATWVKFRGGSFSGDSSATSRTRCEAKAFFSSRGVIESIETVSRNCDEEGMFGIRNLEALMRETPEDDQHD